jgi:hypothetical protein
METRSRKRKSVRRSKAKRTRRANYEKQPKENQRSVSKSSATTAEPSKSISPKASQESESSTDSPIQVLQPQPASPMELYPYQRRWIEGKSRLKIAVKSRRIGYSFADAPRASRRPNSSTM